MRKLRSVLTIAFLLLLSACSFNLAGDITPPPGWHPTPVPPTPDMSTLYPALPPNPTEGKAIYDHICAACHGETGMGNGPQAETLPSAPAALTAPDELRRAVPAQWFLTVTEGNPARGMPPYGNDLTARQRWDVLAYLYTLGISQETFDRGAELYQQRCTACHGPDGQGQNLTSRQWLAQKSNADLFEAMLGPQHKAETVEGLSEDDRWALAAYIRSLAFDRQDATEETAATAATPEASETPAATPEEATPAPEEGTLTITGTVNNGTAGGEVPTNLEITLHGYDTSGQSEIIEAFSLTTNTDAEGKFTFHDVPNASHRIFVTTTEYQGVIYGSRNVIAPAEETLVELPITIYETTTDTSALKVDRLHVLVSLPAEKTLRIVELYVISNTGDKTVAGETPESPALTFSLPANAAHLQFQDGILGGRYVATADGFGDLMPIYPQSTTQEVFAYEIPFEGKQTTVSHPVPLDVAAAVLMAPEGVLTLEGDGLLDNGLQTDNEGNTFHVYVMDALASGSDLAYTVRRASAGFTLGTKTNLAIGLMALGVALIAAALVLTRRDRKTAAAQGAADTRPPAPEDPVMREEDPEILMDAILTLDDQYKAGQINEEAYQRRRAALKARLKDLLERQ